MKGSTKLFFTLPCFLILFGIMLFPLIRCIWLSLYSIDLSSDTMEFIGLKNFLETFSDPDFIDYVNNTLLFTTISVSLEFTLGLAIALLLNKSLKGQSILRASVLIPWILPTAVMALSWRWIFNEEYGVFNDLIIKLGLTSKTLPWLASPPLAMFTCIFSDIWKTTPFVALILFAGLKAIPNELYEALSIDGAGGVRRFLILTLPLLKPYIALALLFRIIHAIGIFDLIWVLTGGGPADSTKTIALYIYDTAFRHLNIGYGASLTVMTAIGLFIIALVITSMGRSKY